MKTKKKALLTVLCAVMLVVGSVFGTYAYLTDTTGPVTNTFTIGNVRITLNEKDVDNDSNTQDNVTVGGVVRDTANSYKLFPGKSYVKDPTVTVDANSEDCWLFVTFKEEHNTFGKNDKIVQYTNDWTGWTKLETQQNDGTVVYYRAVKKTDTTKSWVLLTPDSNGNHITVNANLTNDTMPSENATPVLNFKAYAIQQEGFTTAADAWAELTKA